MISIKITNQAFLLLLLFFYIALQTIERLGNEQMVEKLQDLEDSTARVSNGDSDAANDFTA